MEEKKISDRNNLSSSSFPPSSFLPPPHLALGFLAARLTERRHQVDPASTDKALKGVE